MISNQPNPLIDPNNWQLSEPTLQSPWKLAVIFVDLFVFVVGGLTIALVLWNKQWAPFRAKQPLVLLASLIASFLWITGDLQAIGVIQQTGIFINCQLWSVWCQIVLGAHLYLAIILFRLLRLHFILVLSKPATGPTFWSILALAYLPNVFLGLLPLLSPYTFMSNTPVVIPDSNNGDLACNFLPLYGDGLAFFVLMELLLVMYLNFRISRVRAAFNEFRETRNAIYILLVIIVLNFIVSLIRAENNTSGKIFICVSQLIASNLLFWCSLLKPVVGFLSDKDSYEYEWRRGLRDEKLPEDLNYGVRFSSTGTGYTAERMSMAINSNYENMRISSVHNGEAHDTIISFPGVVPSPSPVIYSSNHSSYTLNNNNTHSYSSAGSRPTSPRPLSPKVTYTGQGLQ